MPILNLGRSELCFLAAVCILSSIFFAALFPWNSFYPDQEQYIILGNDILHGEYSFGVFHRGPVLPAFVAAALAFFGILSGSLLMSMLAALFWVPLLITNLTIITVFLFSRRFLGNGPSAYLSVIVFLTIPYFWRWTNRLLVDGLLTIIFLISLWTFLEMTENKRGSARTGSLTALAALTKFSGFILLPIYAIYILFRKGLGFLSSADFFKSLVVFAVLFGAAAIFIFLSAGTSGLEHLLYFSSVSTPDPLYYLLMFAVVPWSVFFLIGILHLIRNKNRTNEMILATMAFFVFLAVFQLAAFKESRFVVPILPLYAIIAAYGFDWLKNRLKTAASALFAVFAVFGLIMSAWLVSFDSYHHLATVPAAEYASGLDENMLLATEVSPDFIEIFHENSIYFPGNEIESGEGQSLDSWINENKPDYVMISIYREFNRHPNVTQYYPDFFGFKYPVKHSYSTVRPPPDFEFKSDVHRELEMRYERSYEKTYNGKAFMIVYKIS